jgi:uncharacterized protein YecA (UPF0149 family)
MAVCFPKDHPMTIREGLKRLLLGPEPQAVPVLGRNDRCWCGSGKKYKSCHLAGDERKRTAERKAAAPPRRGAAF